MITFVRSYLEREGERECDIRRNFNTRTHTHTRTHTNTHTHILASEGETQCTT